MLGLGKVARFANPMTRVVPAMYRRSSIWQGEIMRTTIALILRFFGLLSFDRLAKYTSEYPSPDRVQREGLVVVRDGDVEKWACLACPGGCGKMIALSLNPGRRPKWQVALDFWNRPTIKPSVHQLNECGCHFWITSGSIDWCPGGRPTNSKGVL